MDWIDIIIPVASTLFGGGVVAFLKYKRESKSDLFDRLDGDNERLRARELKNEKDIRELQKMVHKLQGKLSMMEQAHHNLPIPQWIKDKGGEILSMNAHCHRVFVEPFGFSRLEAIGLTDRDIFPSETADVIEENDAIVKKKRKPIRSIERLLIGDDWQDWAVTRYPIMHEGTLVAIGGIAYELVKAKE